MNDLNLDTQSCLRAMQAKDRRFDGRFFIAVRTTGVFCRPVCPVSPPKAANVTIFRSSAAALEAGYRPCLRCRPETAPGTPAWSGTSATVSRALRLIDAGALNDGSIEQLATRLGVTGRHLGRLFQQHVGASPKAVAQSRRLQHAKRLIDDTSAPMTEIALAAGYGSLRRFNDHFRQVYNRPPSELRRATATPSSPELQIRLRYRAPYAWQAMLDFLDRRAVPGVEWVADDSWHRRFDCRGQPAEIVVGHSPASQELHCRLLLPNAVPTLDMIGRIRSLFDLDADPGEINACLGSDSGLAPLLETFPGLRVPGAWDGFEVAVRAIVGQQISVAGATTIMQRIAEQHGQGGLFPDATALAGIDATALPMPALRARSITTLARAVAEGDIDLGPGADRSHLQAQLQEIKGIGPWTANYVAMRVLSDPDAFLEADLGLLRAARRLYGDDTPRALGRRAERWRPWRAYASLYLWQSENVSDASKTR